MKISQTLPELLWTNAPFFQGCNSPRPVSSWGPWQGVSVDSLWCPARGYQFENLGIDGTTDVIIWNIETKKYVYIATMFGSIILSHGHLNLLTLKRRHEMSPPSEHLGVHFSPSPEKVPNVRTSKTRGSIYNWNPLQPFQIDCNIYCAICNHRSVKAL